MSNDFVHYPDCADDCPFLRELVERERDIWTRAAEILQKRPHSISVLRGSFDMETVWTEESLQDARLAAAYAIAEYEAETEAEWEESDE